MGWRRAAWQTLSFPVPACSSPWACSPLACESADGLGWAKKSRNESGQETWLQFLAAFGTQNNNGIGLDDLGVQSEAASRPGGGGEDLLVVQDEWQTLRNLLPTHNNFLWIPFQLGPQAHAEDTERGQHPVSAFSHHGCQVRVLLAVVGKAEGGARDPWEPAATSAPWTLILLPSQQPGLAELWSLEGRRDPYHRQYRGGRSSDSLYPGISALQSSEGRGPSLALTSSPHPALLAEHTVLFPGRLVGWH